MCLWVLLHCFALLVALGSLVVLFGWCVTGLPILVDLILSYLFKMLGCIGLWFGCRFFVSDSFRFGVFVLFGRILDFVCFAVLLPFAWVCLYIWIGFGTLLFLCSVVWRTFLRMRG